MINLNHPHKNFIDYSKGFHVPEKKKNLPVSQYQILSERLFPLISMLVLFGFLQLLSAFYYQPMDTYNGFTAPAIMAQEDLPFPILVRNTRVGLGVSRRTLAQKVHLSIENIVSIEEGDAAPTRETELALRDALGLAVVSGQRQILP